MVIRAPDGRDLKDDEWTTRQHELVFDALKRVFEHVEFPVSRNELLDDFGNEPVLREPDVRLGPYLETLPDRRFASEDDVARALDSTWVGASQQLP